MIDREGTLKHLSGAFYIVAIVASAGGLKAISTALSGTGSDGSMGLQATKKTGGTMIVQEGAEFSGMSDAAVKNSDIDLIRPQVEKCPRRSSLVTKGGEG